MTIFSSFRCWHVESRGRQLSYVSDDFSSFVHLSGLGGLLSDRSLNGRRGGLVGLLEDLLVLLLGLNESILELVGVCSGVSISAHKDSRGLAQQAEITAGNSLSELAKRMARVTASGSPSLTSAAAFHTQDRSEPTLGDSFISGTM